MKQSYRISFDINILGRVQHLAKFRNVSLTAMDFQESPKTVLMSLRHLESWLGLRLFRRTGETILGITEAGEAYLEYADAILKAKKTFDDKMLQLRGRVIETRMHTEDEVKCVSCPRCTNCGAPIDVYAEKCEYCGSILVVH